MTIHTFHLAAEPFEAIRTGQKTIESRLYDEKRQQIELGDKLLFINREVPQQTIRAIVVGLLRYETFKDLFEHNDPAKFGGASVEWLVEQINEFYDTEAQRQHGVVGIELRLI